LLLIRFLLNHILQLNINQEVQDLVFMTHKIITEMHNGNISASNTTYEYNGQKCFKITLDCMAVLN